jgi:hypothetical protein
VYRGKETGRLGAFRNWGWNVLNLKGLKETLQEHQQDAGYNLILKQQCPLQRRIGLVLSLDLVGKESSLFELISLVEYRFLCTTSLKPMNGFS